VPDLSTLAVFSGAALLLLVVPGPAVLYIVTQSIEHGRRAGLVCMFGIEVGGLVHVAAAAVGLSALLVHSAVAFNAVKYAGAAYLVFLGLRRLLGGVGTDLAPARRPARIGRLFRQGIVVNVLNPKTALFFFAFLPQFVDPDAGPVALQITLLGVLFTLMAVASDGAYAVAAGTASGWLRGNQRFVAVQRWLSGTVLVGLGVTAAVSGSHGK
jgi:threonine/homoserine/homoserine lactone efflux protein